MIDCLQARGELDNTLIVLAGDNGLALGQHGLMGKQNLYDHSVRVPLIFAGPHVPAGERSTALCTLSDLFPTLCGLCDVSTPESVTGRDLSCDWSGRSATGELYLAYANTIRGLTDGQFKLIEYACGDTQLFDLENDPWETENLVGHSGQQDRLHAMRRSLQKHRVRSGEISHPEGATFWQRRGS